MTDVFTPEVRSRVMRAVRSAATKPEMRVLAILKQLGCRPRTNVTALPGTPDFTVPKLRLAIFVHGCYWHRHACEAGRSCPQTNCDYWQAKFERNQARDLRVRRALRAAGWKTLVVWECQTQVRRLPKLEQRLRRRLASLVKIY